MIITFEKGKKVIVHPSGVKDFYSEDNINDLILFNQREILELTRDNDTLQNDMDQIKNSRSV